MGASTASFAARTAVASAIDCSHRAGRATAGQRVSAATSSAAADRHVGSQSVSAASRRAAVAFADGPQVAARRCAIAESRLGDRNGVHLSGRRSTLGDRCPRVESGAEKALGAARASGVRHGRGALQTALSLIGEHVDGTSILVTQVCFLVSLADGPPSGRTAGFGTRQ